MTKDINKLRFNLTSDMSVLLLEFNNLKKEYEETQNPELLKKLDSIRQQFIKEFRMYNKKEIEEYLKLKEKLKKTLFFLFKKSILVFSCRIIYIENKF